MSSNLTGFLDDIFEKVPQRQREWHIQNNIFSPVYCKTCKTNTVKWSVKNKKYSTYCSSKCAHACPDVRAKTETTCYSKFGAKTNLLTPSNKAKVRATCIEKFGVDNFSKTDLFKEQFTKTSIERYGVSNPSKLQAVKDKINDSHFLKYGRKRSSQVHIPADIIELKNNHDEMRRLFFELKMPVSEIAEQLGVCHSQLCVHFKENLGIDISRHAVSSVERQVFDFISSLGIRLQQSVRTVIPPKELDMFSPEFNIAIELDGIAWHTELRGKSKTYHKNKTNQCNALGIRLVHIIDLEWQQKQEIVKSRLSGMFGKNTRIFARKCEVVQLSAQQASEFFKETHIQGACASAVCYALAHRGEIICAMSFDRSGSDKTASWELLRFSSALFTNVVGGASRLFEHFVDLHSPDTVISYCDLRWNTGNLYNQLGFELTDQTEPNYWYTYKYKTLENRIHYQKHKLADKLHEFNSKLTEWENMAAHGFDRIWDCGNAVFVWRK